MKKPLFLRPTALLFLTTSLLVSNNVVNGRARAHDVSPTAHTTAHNPVSASPAAIASPAAASPAVASPAAAAPSPSASQLAPHVAFDDTGLPLTQSFQDVRYQELTAATQSFFDTLTAEQKDTVILDFDDPFRTRSFCYVLARCNDEYVGLQMQDLNSEQKIALNNLLMKSFSGAGYVRAIQTMNREWLVEETENAHRADPENYPTVGSPLVAEWTPPPQRAAPNYYIAFFGEPGTMDPWGIRFEGHHLSYNLTFGGEGESPTVGTAPMFFGSSPMIIAAAPEVADGEANPYTLWQQQEGQQLLHRETWLARSFLNALDAPTRDPGTWSALPDVIMAGGAEVPLDASSYLEGEKPGIAVADLTPVQQQLLLEFALEFLELQSSAHIDVAAFTANMATARVWWFGDREDEQNDLYFRIQSDRYLIELLQSNTFGVVSEVDSNHVHASFRDLTSDWDHNSLGAHLRQHHDATATHQPAPDL